MLDLLVTLVLERDVVLEVLEVVVVVLDVVEVVVVAVGDHVNVVVAKITPP